MVALGCSGVRSHNLPPAHRLLEPGPGVGGPGPGVLAPALPPVVDAGMPAQASTVQILFDRPEGMQLRWDVSGAGSFDSEPLIVPGRQNFPEGGIYRLKLTNIAGREGVELYPTLEVATTNARTAAFLAHNAIPVQFTDEDFDQVLTGNFVTKVIYLPDPDFQEMAIAGVETLVSTRLDPGVDPIVEADRRGSIMAVLRLGNKDLEMPGVVSDQVVGASYMQAMEGAGVPTPAGAIPGGPLPSYVSGVTTPMWGMPVSGTPIGLPGPPHIPFGAPAGFQRQTIRNHTHMHIPGPTEDVSIHVRQQPGYSYPRPPSHVYIREQNIHPSLPFHQPVGDRIQVVH